MKSIGSMVLAGILFSITLALSLAGVTAGIVATGAYAGYGALGAAMLLLLGILLWLASVVTRAMGRLKKCEDCLRDGTPGQYNPFLHRPGTQTNPDESGVRTLSIREETQKEKEKRTWES